MAGKLVSKMIYDMSSGTLDSTERWYVAVWITGNANTVSQSMTEIITSYD